MTAKELFRKTMPFIQAKLILGGGVVVISAILLVIMMALGWLFGEGAIFFMLLLWAGAVGVIRGFIMHYVGYLVKAGHIAVIARACATGQIPANQVEYGKNMVVSRFATSNVYFAIDKLISAAVKQIQNGLGKLGNALDFIPGMEAVTGLAQFFVSISLGYVDECCLGWTFYNTEQDVFKSAADGVVIYAQNWKTLLKDAAKTMVKVILLSVVMVLIIFVPIGLLFKLLKWSGFAAFLLACLITWVVKFACLDSYIMIQMMASYMQEAPHTQITFDLYNKLCKLSKSFKELFEKGKSKVTRPAYAAAGAASYGNDGYGETVQTSSYETQGNVGIRQGSKEIFCGECGASNEAGIKFCGECGASL